MGDIKIISWIQWKIYLEIVMSWVWLSLGLDCFCPVSCQVKMDSKSILLSEFSGTSNWWIWENARENYDQQKFIKQYFLSNLINCVIWYKLQIIVITYKSMASKFMYTPAAWVVFVRSAVYEKARITFAWSWVYTK